MLTEAEQRQLAAIEAQLQATDPALARQFKAAQRGQRRGRQLAAAIVTVAVLAGVLFMTHGAVGSFIVVFSSLLIAKYFVRRNMMSKLPGHYARYGDRID